MSRLAAPPLAPRSRMLGIRALLDEAHGALPPDGLAELLLAVRRTLREEACVRGAGTDLVLATLRPGLSQAARVYFRPIELLLNVAAATDRPLDEHAIALLDRYVDEIATRPRGAAAGSGVAA